MGDGCHIPIGHLEAREDKPSITQLLSIQSPKRDYVTFNDVTHFSMPQAHLLFGGLPNIPFHRVQ